jgi:hypothetical protein
MIAEELQAAGVVGRDQHLQKQPAEQIVSDDNNNALVNYAVGYEIGS